VDGLELHSELLACFPPVDEDAGHNGVFAGLVEAHKAEYPGKEALLQQVG
jgi:hypothetical protein